MITVASLISDEAKLRAAGPPEHPEIRPWWVKWNKARNKLREKALGSLWYFVSEVSQATCLWEPYHRPLCESLEKNTTGLYLLPRGTLKSTIISELYVIWTILKYPDSRVLISSWRAEDAKLKIANHYDIWSRPWINFLFPEHSPKADARKVTTWISPQKKHFGEPSVSVATLGSLPVGPHFTLHINDDLISRENAFTALGLADVRSYAAQLGPTLVKIAEYPTEVPPHTITVGTHWTYDSHYTDIEKKITEKIIKGCWEVDAKGEVIVPHIPTCPTRLPEDAIMKAKEGPDALPDGVFSAQFMNMPRSEEQAWFKSQNLNFYDGLLGEDIDPNIHDPLLLDTTGMTLIITIDCSKLDATTEGDDTAIVLIGIDAARQYWIVDMKRGRLSSDDAFGYIFYLWNKHKPLGVYVESNGIGKDFIAGLENYQKDQQQWINVVPVESRQNKQQRIKWSLQPLINRKGLFLRRGPVQETLVEQIVRYPLVPKDDAIDALALAMNDVVEGDLRSLPIPTLEHRPLTPNEMHGTNIMTSGPNMRANRRVANIEARKRINEMRRFNNGR